VTTGSTGDAAADTTTDDSVSDDDHDDTDEQDEERETTEESNESETTDEKSERPSSRVDLEAMSYRELQQFAKSVDVTANLAREEMEDKLVETLDLDE